MTITLPELNAGEKYAGILLGKNGEPDCHVILMPRTRRSVTYDSAAAWATGRNGSLPSTREMALVEANCNIKAGDYWTPDRDDRFPDHAASYKAPAGYTRLIANSRTSDALAIRRIPLDVADTRPELNENESYCGVILDEAGRIKHHLVLLLQENGQANILRREREEAAALAAKRGGCLPTLKELTLIYANRPGFFRDEYYRSSEPHEKDRDSDWAKNLDRGGQEALPACGSLPFCPVRREKSST